MTRIQKLKSTFSQCHIDALLVTQDVNITYLTKFPASESWFLVGPKQPCYITDSRYVLEAREGLSGVSVRRYTKSIIETLFKLAAQQKIKRLGIDDRHLTLAQYRAMERLCPKGIHLVPAAGLVESLREIKDRDEISQIKTALQYHKQAHTYLKRIVKPGIAEQEILFKLEHFVKSRRIGFSFSPIVASGPNSCFPHARVTERKVRLHEPLLIDMGIDVNGYKSDLTRMFFLGKISELVKQVNECVYEAQQRAIAKIHDGVSVAEVDRAARQYLAKHKLSKYFGHALGHGVGLDIHEGPRLAQNTNDVLKEGMVVTVEPAVYIPNQFGIRIEDMVLVTKNSCEILSDNIH